MNDLDWADRETVLRLLFSKMNTGEAATNWRDNQAPSRNPSQATSNSQGGALNQAFREEQDNDDYDGEDGEDDGNYVYAD